jgi:hypothetical protein
MDTTSPLRVPATRWTSGRQEAPEFGYEHVRQQVRERVASTWGAVQRFRGRSCSIHRKSGPDVMRVGSADGAFHPDDAPSG